MLYLPGTAGAEDPGVAEALALPQQDPELASWLADYCAFSELVRVNLTEIQVPPSQLHVWQIVNQREAI